MILEGIVTTLSPEGAQRRAMGPSIDPDLNMARFVLHRFVPRRPIRTSRHGRRGSFTSRTMFCCSRKQRLARPPSPSRRHDWRM